MSRSANNRSPTSLSAKLRRHDDLEAQHHRDAAAIYDAVRSTENGFQRRRIAECLAHRLCTGGSRSLLERWDVWLAEDPARELVPIILRRLVKIEAFYRTADSMEKAGKPFEQRERPANYKPPRHAMKWPDKRPAWIGKPNIVPPVPPPRRADDSEDE